MCKHSPKSTVALLTQGYPRLIVILATLGAMFIPWPAFAAAIVANSFNSATLLPNDDSSSLAVPLGFDININSSTYTTIYVNNNGNATLGGSLTAFTPSVLTTFSLPIFAPFFADVDTRSSSIVTYGQGTYAGRSAFGINWIDVGCFSQEPPRNSFQLILVDRADTGTGNIDVVFNYDQIHWESGTASGGSAGTCLGGTNTARAGLFLGPNRLTQHYELPGSGIAGTLLDGVSNALVNGSQDSSILGRYVFEVRNDMLPVVSRTLSPTPVPSLSQGGMLLLSGLLGALAWQQRRRKVCT